MSYHGNVLFGDDTLIFSLPRFSSAGGLISKKIIQKSISREEVVSSFEAVVGMEELETNKIGGGAEKHNNT